MVCFDTSFIIALLRRDMKAEKKLEGYIKDNVRISTTPITACELFKGAFRSNRRELEVEKVKKILGYLDLLNFSIEASEEYGRLVNGIQGSMIGDLDAMIASLALTSKESIITSNVKHFERVPGLIVETW